MTTKRKATPDILADILNGETTAVIQPSPPAVAATSRRPSAVLPRAPSRRSVERTSPTAAHWEYQVVTLQDCHGWRPRYRDGFEIANWMDGPQLHDFLAAMGGQGWELAAAASGERLYGLADRHQLYFKRLVQK